MVKFEKHDDGIFYMCFEDFLKYYPYTFVCKFNDEYHYKFKKVYQYSEDTIVGCRIRINKKTNATFGIHQKQERFFHRIKNYKPSHAKFFLIRCKGNEGYEYIGSNEGSLDKLYIETEKPLEEGDYIILANVRWPYYEEKCSIVFSSYSDNPNIEFLNLERKSLSKDYINKIILSMIEKKFTYKILGSENKSLSYVISFKDIDAGYFFVSFKNEGFRACEIIVRIHKSKNIDIVSKNLRVDDLGEDMYDYTLILGPMCSEVVIFEQKDDIWNCEISLKSIKVNYDLDYSIESDFSFIHENKDQLIREPFIGDDIFYSELKRDNYLLIVLSNRSENDYMIKAEFFKLVNCEVEYPGRSMFRLNSRSTSLIKLKIFEPKDIDYELEYSYKNLSTMK